MTAHAGPDRGWPGGLHPRAPSVAWLNLPGLAQVPSAAEHSRSVSSAIMSLPAHRGAFRSAGRCQGNRIARERGRGVVERRTLLQQPQPRLGGVIARPDLPQQRFPVRGRSLLLLKNLGSGKSLAKSAKRKRPWCAALKEPRQLQQENVTADWANDLDCQRQAGGV